MNTKHDDKKDARKEERTEPRDTAAHEDKEAAATKAAAAAQAEEAASQPKPFPSQADQDRFALGERGFDLTPDGSPPSAHGIPVDHKLGRKTPEEEELEKAGFKKADKDAQPEHGAPYKPRAHVAEKKKED